MPEPILIISIVTAVTTGFIAVLQFLQSAKIHNIQISSCMKTQTIYKKNSSSSDSSMKKRKKKDKKRKRRNSH